MTDALRVFHQSRNQYVRAFSSAWRRLELYEPSVWLQREPEIVAKMLRDADISAPVTLRGHMIAGRDWTLTPLIEDSPRAEMAVFVGTELLKGIRDFTSARYNLAMAFLHGRRFAHVHCMPRKLALGDGQTRTWMVPTRLEDVDSNMIRTVPDHDPENEKLAAHYERWHTAKTEWQPLNRLQAMELVKHVYHDDQASLGYGRGLREALGWWWWAKTHVFSESLTAAERFAAGQFHVKVDGMRSGSVDDKNREVLQAYVNTLEDMRGQHVLATDKEDEVEVLSPSGQGWQILTDLRAELKTTITTLVLGANIPTTATEGGSYALGMVQENTTEALIQFDRELLQEALTRDLIQYIWHLNYPNLVELAISEEKPRFNITQEKRQEPAERAGVAEILSRMGVDLALDDVLEQTGFRRPEDGEEIVPGGSAPEPAAGPFGGFAK
jgi:phage gp29-like protein